MSTNGHDEIAAARDYLSRSASGQHVLTLYGNALTGDHFEALAKAIVPFVKAQAEGAKQVAFEIENNTRAIATQQNRTIAELVSRVQALERQFVEFKAQRIAEIEQRNATLELQVGRALKEGGIWREGRVYQTGDQVSFQDVPWNALRETTSRPGTDDSWRRTTNVRNASR